MNFSESLRHPLFVPLLVQLTLAYEWLQGGWGKIRGGTFVDTIGKTLERFENGNPHTWYVNSVLDGAQSRPELFGQLVQWGELLTGIGLLIAVLIYVLGKNSSAQKCAAKLSLVPLLGGSFMNGNFYLAAGSTSASTSGLNILMIWMQLILLAFWITALFPKTATKKS